MLSHTYSSTTRLGPDDIKAAAYEWADRMNINLLQVRIRSMSRKWASISTIGRLTLSDDLLKISKQLGEFVSIHELVHLIVPNHGKVFKSFSLAYLPDWEKRAAAAKISKSWYWRVTVMAFVATRRW
ncbi:MAG: M48 family metallopeptidase [Halobacteriota archaeon]|jgi:predicted metal-dependent hydrolase